MFNLHVSTMIGAPIKHVFDFMSVPENDFQWQYGTLAASTIADRHNEMGIYFRSIGHLMGRRNLSTYEVIEYELNRKYGFKTLSGPFHLETFYTFEMVDNKTKVNAFTQVTINSPQFNESILEKKMQKQLMENMAMLKDLLEEQAKPLLDLTVRLPQVT